MSLPDCPTEERSDQALVAAVNNGDPEAFEVLYRRHRDWVVNLAFRFTGDRDLALDVLQETFLYWLKKFPGFELRCQLTSFFYPVVRNLAITARRKAERCQSDGTDLAAFEAEGPEGGSGAGDHSELAAALAGLSEEHREVLLLRFVQDLSLAEIADAMAVPLGTAKSRLHHALENLRRDARAEKYFEQ